MLGRLLEGRRRELGHTWRTTFEAASGVNRRLAADIESAAKDRVNRFMPGTWQLIAAGYQVTEESMAAVLRGEADGLTPAPPAEPPPAPGLPPAPMDQSRDSAIRPYAGPIWEALYRLLARGITDPSGAQLIAEVQAGPDGARLGLDYRDARIWGGSEGAMGLADRVWLVADMHAARAARSADPGTGSASA